MELASADGWTPGMLLGMDSTSAWSMSFVGKVAVTPPGPVTVTLTGMLVPVA